MHKWINSHGKYMHKHTHAHTHTSQRAHERVIEVTAALNKSILSSARLSHSVDAVACYIIVVPGENLTSPPEDCCRRENVSKTSTLSHNPSARVGFDELMKDNTNSFIFPFSSQKVTKKKSHWVLPRTQRQGHIIGWSHDECVL